MVALRPRYTQNISTKQTWDLFNMRTSTNFSILLIFKLVKNKIYVDNIHFVGICNVRRYNPRCIVITIYRFQCAPEGITPHISKLITNFLMAKSVRYAHNLLTNHNQRIHYIYRLDNWQTFEVCLPIKKLNKTFNCFRTL